MTTELTNILNQPVIKHSVNIAGHSTSISLEKPFWQQLKQYAKENNKSLASLVAEIDDARSVNLSSAIRLFVMHQLLK